MFMGTTVDSKIETPDVEIPRALGWIWTQVNWMQLIKMTNVIHIDSKLKTWLELKKQRAPH